MIRKLALITVSIFVLSSLRAASPVEIEIERTADRYNLGIAPFFTQGRGTDSQTALNYRAVVEQDLDFSKLFNLVTQGPAVKRGGDATAWRAVGSDMVLTGTAQLKSGDRLELEARIFDTVTGKEVAEIEQKGQLADARNLAHAVANDVVQYFTGKPGIFLSKIGFVNDSTGRKELYLADYDGKNLKRVTRDNSIVVLPRISPDASKVIFTSYRSGNPDLYVMNIDGSGRRQLSAKAGLNVSPSWAPSGQEFALTLSIRDAPNIYLLDLNGKVKEPLTRGNTADTAPAISPDGRQLVFTSDRAGQPHIYIMNMDGTGLRRLTTDGYCDSAAWSPDGQIISYVKGKSRAKFDIYSIEVYTGIERRLTWADGDNENPVWSPDGRFILFTSTRRGKSELFIMDRDGSNQRPHVEIKGESFTPHWGG